VGDKKGGAGGEYFFWVIDVGKGGPVLFDVVIFSLWQIFFESVTKMVFDFEDGVKVDFGAGVSKYAKGNCHIAHFDLSSTKGERKAVVVGVVPGGDTHLAGKTNEVGESVKSEDFDGGNVVGVGKSIANLGGSPKSIVVVFGAVFRLTGDDKTNRRIDEHGAWSDYASFDTEGVVERFDAGAGLA